MIKSQKNKEVAWERGKTLFLDVIGYSVKGRIWDWLLTTRELDFSKTDIIDCSGVNKTNGFKVAKWMIKNKYVIPSRKIKNNKVQLYKLNKKDERIKNLIKVFDSCLIKEKK